MSLYVDSGYVDPLYTFDTISIDWANKIIFVPKNYLTPTSNPAVFNLDTNEFRLTLKDLEGEETGMTYDDTHQHNTEVPLGGIIYARVIEIINDYTITFENGFYAVNLFGSNNNIGDVTNLNFVSVRTNNSAGLIVDPGISQSLDYGEHVIYDADDGVAGDAWPVGTYAAPVNNPADLQKLLTLFNRSEVVCLSDITLTQDFEDVAFVSKTGDESFFPNGFKAHDCSFNKMKIQGDFNHSKIFATECSFNDVSNLGGTIFGSILFGDILQTPNYQLVLNKCSSTKPGITPVVIDMVVATDTVFGTRGHSGPLSINNCDTPNSVATIIYESGGAFLNSSCTDGLIAMGGIASVTDNSTSGCTVDITGVIDPDTSNNMAYNGKVNLELGTSNVGVNFPVGTLGLPVNNLADALTIANDRGLDVIHIHNDWTFTSGTFIDDFTIEGDSLQKSEFTFEPDVIMLDCTIKDAKCTGDITGIIGFDNCHLIDIGSTFTGVTSRDIIILDSLIDGSMFVPSAYSGVIKVIGCWSNIAGSATPTFNWNNSNADLLVRNYTGGLTLSGCTQPINCSIDLASGKVILDESVHNGNFTIRGVGAFEDRSLKGNGTTVNTNGLVDARDIKNAKIAAETLRPHHTGLGDTYYWDPFTGDDTNDGKSLETATKTFEHAHDLVLNGHHDVIIAVAAETGTTITTERIHISKNYTFLRGPGLDFQIRPTEVPVSGETATVEITGEGVEIAGMFVGTPTSGITNSIHVHDCAFTNLDKLWFKGSTGHGAYFSGDGIYHRVTNTFMDETGGDGLRFDGNIRHFVIENTEIANAEGNGITVMGGDGNGKYARNNVIGQNTLIHGTQGWGVHFQDGTNKNTVSFNADLYLNTLGNVLDEGINNTDKSFINDAAVQEYLTYGTQLVYNEVNGFSGSTFPIGTAFKPVNNVEDALIISDRYNIHEFSLASDMNVTSNISNLKIIGISNSLIKSSGSTVNNCHFINTNMFGDFGNSFVITESCVISDTQNVYGAMDNCYLNGTLLLSVGSNTTISHSSSSIPGTSSPVIDMNSGGTTTLSVRDYSGGLRIKNANTSGCTATVEFVGGKMHIDPSCTDGLLDIRGVAYLNDETNGGGSIILSNALLDPSAIVSSGTTTGTTECDSEAIAIAVWNELTAGHNLDGTFGKTILNLVTKAEEAQHTLNVQTEMLKNKPNNC